MHIHRPGSQGEKGSRPLNAQMRALVNGLNEKKDKSIVSKAGFCTKSKKEVSGNFFCEQLPCLSNCNMSISQLAV